MVRLSRLTMIIRSLIQSLSRSDLVNFEQRRWLYRRLGVSGGQFFISPHCRIVYPRHQNIWLGDRSFLNQDCYLENGEAIAIGQDTCLGPGVRILTTSHTIGPSTRRVSNGCDRRPVKIGRGVWIGAGAIILPGVTIGDGCVVGAGAVVARDCDRDGLYVGVPAQLKRALQIVDRTCSQ